MALCELGLQWSAALHDGLAWAAFATYGTRRRSDFQPGFELQLLEEAEDILKAWAGGHARQPAANDDRGGLSLT